MKKVFLLIGIYFIFAGWICNAQKVEMIPFGDMDHWVVREIHESGIIGGNTKHLYELGPTDTIIGNTAYTNRGGSPWANSNVMAKVAGVVKTNTSVFPERRDNGWCARLETRMESVKVFGGSRRFRFSRNGARTDQGDQESAGHVEQWSGVYQEAEGVAF